MRESIICFHYFIEFLILYKLVNRFLEIYSNIVFSIRIPENLQKCLGTMRNYRITSGYKALLRYEN